jgi:monoamine oxidase
MNASSPLAATGSPPDAVIVGAGLSGLLTAHLLEQAGLDVCLVEARDRVGGRILGIPATVGATAVAHRYDLGPAWVWPDINPRLAHWLPALDLAVYPQHDQGAALVEGPGRELRRHAAGYTQQPPSMRIVGGIAALTHALQSSLQRTRVLLGTRVTTLAAQPAGGLALQTESAGVAATMTADSVILAMPPRLLATALHWTPALPPDLTGHWAAAPTWMAGQAKLLATYRTPFWRADGLSGTAFSQAGPLVEMHDASDAQGRHAALFGFVGVPAAHRQRISRQALVEAAVAQLARLFGPEAGAPLQVHLQDWADEPDTAAAADRAPAAAHPEPQAPGLPAPWQGQVFLAGTEFAAEFPGYLEGAVRAAEQAAGALLKARADTAARMGGNAEDGATR